MDCKQKVKTVSKQLIIKKQIPGGGTSLGCHPRTLVSTAINTRRKRRTIRRMVPFLDGRCRWYRQVQYKLVADRRARAADMETNDQRHIFSGLGKAEDFAQSETKRCDGRPKTNG